MRTLPYARAAIGGFGCGYAPTFFWESYSDNGIVSGMSTGDQSKAKRSLLREDASKAEGGLKTCVSAKRTPQLTCAFTIDCGDWCQKPAGLFAAKTGLRMRAGSVGSAQFSKLHPSGFAVDNSVAAQAGRKGR